jgi:4-alpha-glucanotransferase
MKQTGILMHIASLPTRFGIGDFGPAARLFADYLVDSGHKIWQILPLNHCGYGNSPYNPLSAFALFPSLVSPEMLFEAGLIDYSDLEEAVLPESDMIVYEEVCRSKEKLLNIATRHYLESNDIYPYINANAHWLKPYMVFNALNRLYDYSCWDTWRPEHRGYNEALYEDMLRMFKPQMLTQAAIQALLAEQLSALKQYLTGLGIQLMGDLPIYLSYHSADVWANQHLFKLDASGKRTAMAGVPPDAFSTEGQLWGNPIYRWDSNPEDVINLFEQRISHSLRYLDSLRLDHFIGYVNYWCVSCPIDDQSGEMEQPVNAMSGEWKKACPEMFFDRITTRFGTNPFIAEDLGILTPEVCQWREKYGFPGMIVLQFCFQDSVPKVEEYPPDRIIYTGTHDNPTTREWFGELDPDSDEMRHFAAFLHSHPDTVPDDHRATDVLPFTIHKRHAAPIMIAIAMLSGCETAIIPMQDILNLDASARMNVPGTALGNWQWRMLGSQL